jgi:D-alanine-D-alanine ligase
VLRELRPGDREPIERLLRATGMFIPEEVDVALELVEIGLGLREGEGCHFILAEEAGRLAGYACYGRCLMTDATWDLYWVAVDPAMQGRGIGVRLVRAVEEACREAGARLLIIETAGKPEYEPTRAFYARIGYPEHARVKDYYRDGDDKIFYSKRLR